VYVRPAGASFAASINDVVLYDADGNLVTSDNQVRASGSFSFSPSVELVLEIRKGLIHRFSFSCNANVGGTLKLVAGAQAASFQSEHTLATYYFQPVIVLIGELPVVIEPVLELKVGVEGSFDIGLEGEIQANAQASAGLSYQNGSWQSWKDWQCQLEGTQATAAAALEAKAYAGGVASIAFYGFISPSTSGAEQAEPWYRLYGGLQGIAGIKVAVLGQELVDYSATIFGWSQLLQEATTVATPPSYTVVSAGGLHSCGVAADGSLWCWGRNAFGQVGDGSTQDRLSPAMVAGLSRDVAAVSAGEGHTCARTGWQALLLGGQGSGQLGSARNGRGECSAAPVAVQELSNVLSVATGSDHTCAALADETAWCWGTNDKGQLRDGSTNPSAVPMPVRGLSGVVAVAAGGKHSCALTGDGAVWCWGWNLRGALGDGSNVDSPVPVRVAGLGGRAEALAAGWEHTCALLAGGAVRCWGWNESGQLGNASTSASNRPVPLQGLSDAVALSAGYMYTCALQADGSIWCWGDNYSGQLGNGRSGSGERSTVPVAVQGLGGVALAVEAGGHHTCAVVQAAQGVVAKCWGWNAFGQLGNGSTQSSSTPVLVR